MAIRNLSTASISTGAKRSKFWDQSALVLVGAYESIASTSFTGSSSSVIFDNIPDTYDHLQIRWSAAINNANDGTCQDWNIKVNNRTTADNLVSRMYSTGTTQSGSVITGQSTMFSGIGALPQLTGGLYFGVGIIDFFNANDTTQKKIFQTFGGTQHNTASTNSRVYKTVHMSQDTARVSRLEFYTLLGNFTSGSTVSLYGVKA